jgi:hypothetical protein
VRRDGHRALKELKWLQKENERLRRAVSDLTLDKLILKEAASENFSRLRACIDPARFQVKVSERRVCRVLASTNPHNVDCRMGVLTKNA